MLILMILSMTAQTANASNDQWLCKEEASQRRSNTVVSCGIGTGGSEDDARAKAFESAKAEFDRVCNASSDCIYHEVKAIPKRTDCSYKDNQYVCYRLVDFTIGQAKMINGQPIQATAKIRVGMTAKQVIAALGSPNRVNNFDLDSSVKMWSFDNKNFCDSQGFCVVDIQNGKVVEYRHFRPEFTNLE